jgi:four helix bundle protein
MDNWNEQFRKRTKQLAIDVIKNYGQWKKTDELRIIGKQLLRSATSVAANYRASCRARSDRECYAKICIVVEEADETVFWIELLSEAGLISETALESVYVEANEIMKVMASYKYKLEKQKT